MALAEIADEEHCVSRLRPRVLLEDGDGRRILICESRD